MLLGADGYSVLAFCVKRDHTVAPTSFFEPADTNLRSAAAFFLSGRPKRSVRLEAGKRVMGSPGQLSLSTTLMKPSGPPPDAWMLRSTRR